MEEPTQNPSIAEWLVLMEACRPREVLPCLAGPIGQAAEGHVMPGVYPELRGFVFAHRKCTGRRRADVSSRAGWRPRRRRGSAALGIGGVRELVCVQATRPRAIQGLC